MLAVVTHTLGTSPWLQQSLSSVQCHLPAGARHHVIEQREGFEQARWDAFQSAEFVALVDDDDEVCNDALNLCMAAILETGAGVAFTDQAVVDEQGETLRTDSGELRYRDVARSPQSIHHLAIVRRSAISDEALTAARQAGTGIEWMVKANAALRHGAVHVPIVGYRWRRHQRQHSFRNHAAFVKALPTLRRATQSWMTQDARIRQLLPR
jgi:hypothetical protein